MPSRTLAAASVTPVSTPAQPGGLALSAYLTPGPGRDEPGQHDQPGVAPATREAATREAATWEAATWEAATWEAATREAATREKAGPEGMLLAVVPVPGTDSSLAIVGYQVPASPDAARDRAPHQAASGIAVDRARRRVWLGGAEVALTFQEFELLSFLSANPGQVFSRGDLLGRVWRQGAPPDTRTVDVHVSRLRRKLGPIYGRCLGTEYRVGYRFDPAAARPTGPGPGVER